MQKSIYFLLSLSVLFIWQCAVQGQKVSPTAELPTQATPVNPAAEGFNAKGSDAKAIEIADDVMLAMGGRDAWDATRFLHWNFFGFRTLLWDKYKGRVRIDVPEKEMTYLVNVNDNSGRIFKAGIEMSHPDSISKYVSRGKSIWINDSYWLVMPYKLKDSGVTLKYSGMGKNSEGSSAHILQLTFENVGDTPQNKYQVFVDPNENLVNGWAFFRNASDEEARFNMPWLDYQAYGKIQLSGNRGQRKLSDISVYKNVPDEAFESPKALDNTSWN